MCDVCEFELGFECNYWVGCIGGVVFDFDFMLVGFVV